MRYWMYIQIINSIIYNKVVFWLVIDIWINNFYLFKKCEFMHHYIFPQLFGGQMSAGGSFQSYWATLYTTEVGGLKSLFAQYWVYEYHMADIIHKWSSIHIPSLRLEVRCQLVSAISHCVYSIGDSIGRTQIPFDTILNAWIIYSKYLIQMIQYPYCHSFSIHIPLPWLKGRCQIMSAISHSTNMFTPVFGIEFENNLSLGQVA